MHCKDQKILLFIEFLSQYLSNMWHAWKLILKFQHGRTNEMKRIKLTTFRFLNGVFVDEDRTTDDVAGVFCVSLYYFATALHFRSLRWDTADNFSSPCSVTVDDALFHEHVLFYLRKWHGFSNLCWVSFDSLLRLNTPLPTRPAKIQYPCRLSKQQNTGPSHSDRCVSVNRVAFNCSRVTAEKSA